MDISVVLDGVVVIYFHFRACGFISVGGDNKEEKAFNIVAQSPGEPLGDPRARGDGNGASKVDGEGAFVESGLNIVIEGAERLQEPVTKGDFLIIGGEAFDKGTARTVNWRVGKFLEAVGVFGLLRGVGRCARRGVTNFGAVDEVDGVLGTK